MFYANIQVDFVNKRQIVRTARVRVRVRVLLDQKYKSLDSCTPMARVYLLVGRAYLKNQSLNKLINQSINQ